MICDDIAELEIPVANDLPVSNLTTHIFTDTTNNIANVAEIINNNNVSDIDNKQPTTTATTFNDSNGTVGQFSIDEEDDLVNHCTEEINDNNEVLNGVSECNIDNNDCANLNNICDGKSIVPDPVVERMHVTNIENEARGVDVDGEEELGDVAVEKDSDPLTTSFSDNALGNAISAPSSPTHANSDSDKQRSDSPPSLEFSAGKYSANSNNDEYDVAANSNLTENNSSPLPYLDDNEDDDDDDVDVYDRRCDLPSLKLDSMRASPVAPIINDQFSLDFTNAVTDDTSRVDNDSPADECCNGEMDDFAFEADFSQFGTFQSIETPMQSAIDHMTTSADGAPSQLSPSAEAEIDIDNAVNEDDDFGDFGDFTTATDKINTGNDPNGDEDDDFGDFNEFQESSVPQTIPLNTSTSVNSISNLIASAPTPNIDIEFNSSKIKPLLNQMFPEVSSDIDVASPGSQSPSTFINNITTVLKDVENSKALEHQWISSVGKNVLVKALGIDSRNIVSHTHIHIHINAFYKLNNP